MFAVVCEVRLELRVETLLAVSTNAEGGVNQERDLMNLAEVAKV